MILAFDHYRIFVPAHAPFGQQARLSWKISSRFGHNSVDLATSAMFIVAFESVFTSDPTQKLIQFALQLFQEESVPISVCRLHTFIANDVGLSREVCTKAKHMRCLNYVHTCA